MYLKRLDRLIKYEFAQLANNWAKGTGMFLPGLLMALGLEARDGLGPRTRRLSAEIPAVYNRWRAGGWNFRVATPI